MGLSPWVVTFGIIFLRLFFFFLPLGDTWRLKGPYSPLPKSNKAPIPLKSKSFFMENVLKVLQKGSFPHLTKTRGLFPRIITMEIWWASSSSNSWECEGPLKTVHWKFLTLKLIHTQFPAIHSYQFVTLVSSAPGKLILTEILCNVPLSLQTFKWWFALGPQFSDAAKKAHWFVSLFSFFVVVVRMRSFGKDCQSHYTLELKLELHTLHF